VLLPLMSTRMVHMQTRTVCGRSNVSYSLKEDVVFLNLTPCNRGISEKLTVSQLLNNHPHFMEPQGSLPHSQESATCSFSEPDRSSPCTPIPFLEYPF
jgi:hypothetical protein